MKAKYKKILFSALIAGGVMAVFIYGQIFYYNRRITAAVRAAPPITDGGLSANLTAALQQTAVILKYQEKEIRVGPDKFKSWVENYTRSYTGKQELRINTDNITVYLEKISKETDIRPVNARLIINDGWVSEFEQPQNGKILNIPLSLSSIAVGLARNSLEIELSVDEIQPKVTLEKVNDLGINELLARGESDFTGSPKSRAHNIAIGSRRFTGILLEPGKEFSFNEWLGDVDAATGYLPELVIKNSTLIPEYGGGLCQVSTTLFRAVALSGLPILERHPHSLPVRYYNPQGFDATIYPGVSDFRFKNDTPAYILIQSEIIGSKIYFEIYGTNDGRKTALDGPRQYDIRSSGALKAELARTVTYPDGDEKKDIFRSSYKAPGSFPTIRNPLE